MIRGQFAPVRDESATRSPAQPDLDFEAVMGGRVLPGKPRVTGATSVIEPIPRTDR